MHMKVFSSREFNWKGIRASERSLYENQFLEEKNLPNSSQALLLLSTVYEKGEFL